MGSIGFLFGFVRLDRLGIKEKEKILNMLTNKQVLIGIFRTLETICNNTVHCKYFLILEMLPVAVKQPVKVPLR